MDIILAAAGAVLLAVIAYRLTALGGEMRKLRRLLVGMAGGLDEKLADIEHGVDQARTAANDVRDAE